MPEVFKKFKDILLGVDIDDDDDYDDEYYEDDYYEEEVVDKRSYAPPKPEYPRMASSRSDRGSSGRGTAAIRSVPAPTNNVVGIHSNRDASVYINAPKDIEQARDVIDNTKQGIISVVNLEGVDSATAQRIADFLSGSVDALDATIRRLSYDMFIIAPSGIEISGNISEDINEELKSSGISLPWLNAAFK